VSKEFEAQFDCAQELAALRAELAKAEAKLAKREEELKAARDVIEKHQSRHGCRSGGMGPEGLERQPCEMCDALEDVLAALSAPAETPPTPEPSGECSCWDCQRCRNECTDENGNCSLCGKPMPKGGCG